MTDKIMVFLNNIKSDGGKYFIEAEAIPAAMTNFINEYNKTHTPNITLYSDGIICLQPDANKWGLELRLYVPAAPPDDILPLFERNKVYKTEYTYRLNNNAIIRELFDKGCKIGIN